MDLLLKASALLLVASLIGLLLRRNNPELGLVLSLTAVTLVFLLAGSLGEAFKAFTETVGKLTENGAALTYPVLKCLGIAILTRVTAELCRDASNAAASSAVELIGTVCALCVALPLILSIVKTIGGLL